MLLTEIWGIGSIKRIFNRPVDKTKTVQPVKELDKVENDPSLLKKPTPKPKPNPEGSKGHNIDTTA